MNTNHHLSKPVMIGRVHSSGTFDVIWQSINPVRANAWSRYIPDSAKRTADWTFLGSAGGASNRHSRIGEGCSSLCACGPKVGSRSKCEELNVRKSGPLCSTSKNPRECTGEPLRNAGIGAGALSRRQSRQTTHLPYPAVSRPTRHGRRLLAHRYRCIAGFGKPFAWQIMGSRLVNVLA